MDKQIGTSHTHFNNNIAFPTSQKLPFFWKGFPQDLFPQVFLWNFFPIHLVDHFRSGTDLG